MARINSFEEITAWQKARVFNLEIYTATGATGAFSKDFVLRDQIRRASVSISSNIAEGFERETPKEFIRFLYIAKGSAGEVRSQLYLAFDLKYISEKNFEKLKNEVTDISKLLSGLINYLNSTL